MRGKQAAAGWEGAECRWRLRSRCAGDSRRCVLCCAERESHDRGADGVTMMFRRGACRAGFTELRGPRTDDGAGACAGVVGDCATILLMSDRATIIRGTGERADRQAINAWIQRGWPIDSAVDFESGL